MDAIRVPGTLDSLSEIRDFVRTVAEQAGLDRKRAYRLLLAADEIATNIANYGYQNGTIKGDILLEARIDDEKLTVTLEDRSPPFDPFTHKPPDNLDSPLEDRPAGGLGIFLATENVDDYRYQYLNGCNHNTLVMRRDNAGMLNRDWNNDNG